MAGGVPSNRVFGGGFVIVFVLGFAITGLVAFSMASSILSSHKRRS